MRLKKRKKNPLKISSRYFNFFPVFKRISLIRENPKLVPLSFFKDIDLCEEMRERDKKKCIYV